MDPKIIADAIRDVFISPNVCDDNLEPANLVDVGDRIATAILELADAIRALDVSDA